MAIADLLANVWLEQESHWQRAVLRLHPARDDLGHVPLGRRGQRDRDGHARRDTPATISSTRVPKRKKGKGPGSMSMPRSNSAVQPHQAAESHVESKGGDNMV